MPSTYAHWLFGQKVFEILPGDIKSSISADPTLFNIGLHGPDLLFYYKPLSKNAVNALGFEIHAESGLDFFSLAGKTVSNGAFAPEYLSYIYGVICHFALDRACHGFIDGYISRTGISHTEIETEFDRYLITRHGGNPLNADLTKHIRINPHRSAVISRFYCGTSPKQITQAANSMRLYHQILRCPFGVKGAVIRKILKATGNYDDMHGLLVNRHPNEKCRESTIELLKRFRNAEREAVQLITEFKSSAAGKAEWNRLYQYTFGSEFKGDNAEETA